MHQSVAMGVKVPGAFELALAGVARKVSLLELFLQLWANKRVASRPALYTVRRDSPWFPHVRHIRKLGDEAERIEWLALNRHGLGMQERLFGEATPQLRRVLDVRFGQSFVEQRGGWLGERRYHGLQAGYGVMLRRQRRRRLLFYVITCLNEVGGVRVLVGIVIQLVRWVRFYLRRKWPRK